MAPLSDSVPKGLIPIAGKTIITRLIEVLTESGVESIRLGVGWKSDLYREHLMELDGTYDLQVVEVKSIERGPLHTLVSTMDPAGDEPFLISPVDYITESDIVKQVITAHIDADDSRLATVSVDPLSKDGSSVFVRSNGRVSGLTKPVVTHDAMYSTAMLTAVNPEAMRFFIEARSSGRITVIDAINQMILNNEKIFSIPIAGRWSDIDTISSLLTANDMILDSSPTSSGGCVMVPSGDVMDFENTVELESGIRFSAGVQIKGPTFIGAGCEIAEDCRIGPNVSMSPDTIVSRDSTLSRCILIGPNHIRKGRNIKDSVIYDDAIFKEVA